MNTTVGCVQVRDADVPHPVPIQLPGLHLRPTSSKPNGQQQRHLPRVSATPRPARLHAGRLAPRRSLQRRNGAQQRPRPVTSGRKERRRHLSATGSSSRSEPRPSLQRWGTSSGQQQRTKLEPQPLPQGRRPLPGAAAREETLQPLPQPARPRPALRPPDVGRRGSPALCRRTPRRQQGPGGGRARGLSLLAPRPQRQRGAPEAHPPLHLPSPGPLPRLQLFHSLVRSSPPRHRSPLRLSPA